MWWLCILLLPVLALFLWILPSSEQNAHTRCWIGTKIARFSVLAAAIYRSTPESRTFETPRHAIGKVKF